MRWWKIGLLFILLVIWLPAWGMTGLSISDELDLASIAPALEKLKPEAPLRIGPLAGQGMWTEESTGGQWLVRDSATCPEGLPDDRYCLTLGREATAAQENAVLSENVFSSSSGKTLVSFYFYPDWQGEPTVSFNLRGLSREQDLMQFSLGSNTAPDNLFYLMASGGAESVGIFDLPPRRWYQVELELDLDTKETRYRLDEGDWNRSIVWVEPTAGFSALQLLGTVDGNNKFFLSNVVVEDL